MKISKLQVVIFLLISELVTAQNPRLSQIWSSPLQINPSLSGRFDGKARIGATYSWQHTEFASIPHQNIFVDLKFGKYRNMGDERQYTKDSTGKTHFQEAKDETESQRKTKGYWGVGFNYYHYGDNTSPLQGTFVSGTVARHFYFKKNRYFGVGAQVAYAKGNLDETRGADYDKEISGGGFRYPNEHYRNGPYKSKTDYVDFNIGGYYAMVTEPVSFEIGLAMYHLFYPKDDIFNFDTETKLRHRLTAHSILRLKLNSKWGFIQRNIYWEEGLYYKSRTFNDSAHSVTFYAGVELYKTQPKSDINFNFGLYSRSFRTVMPYINLSLGRIVNLRYTYEFPINSKKYNAYTAKRSEVALILTYKKNTATGTRFYKKFHYW